MTTPLMTLQDRIRPFLQSDDAQAATQVVVTLGPYLALWWLTYRSLALPYWVTLLLAVPAGGFLLRVFILQHDLGHGSLFRSRRTNDVLGGLFGILTVIPYRYWRRIHAIHHADFGNLDRRGAGDVTTLTVREYLARPWYRRLTYWLHRHPALVLGFGGLVHFGIQHRYPFDAPRSWRAERRSVFLTNLGVLALAWVVASVIGWPALLLTHLPIMFVGTSGAVWLFLNQHSYEHTYWEPAERWDYLASALHGSSYYRLPKPLQWLTANVGLHHVHHLNPRIPSYHLARCREAVPELRDIPPITVRESLKTPWLALWDEDTRRMISFRELRGRIRTGGTP